MLFFAVIDVDPARAGAPRRRDGAGRTRGVLRSSQMAFAQIARAMATGDSASASEIIANYDEDPDRAGDALYQLAAGVALEAQDPAAAIERYRAAAKANADVLSTEIRLIRGLAYSGHGAEARQRLAAASQKWPDRAEVTALAALVAAADPRPGDAASLPRRPTSTCSRGRSARCARASRRARTRRRSRRRSRRPRSRRRSSSAARSRSARATTRSAARRRSARSRWPLRARAGLRARRPRRARVRALRGGRQAALRAPDVAAEVLAFIAYEAGDLAAMTAAAGRRAEDPRTEPVAAGRARASRARRRSGAR